MTTRIVPIIVFALCGISILSHAQNPQTHSYPGKWRGKDVVVSIQWSDFGTVGGSIKGTIYDRSSRRVHDIEGINLNPNFIEFGFADDNYKMTSQWQNGQITWTGGPGDSLTFSRKAAQPPVPTPGQPSGPSMPNLPNTPAPPKPVQEVTLKPYVWEVGKWPEGIAFDGRHFWVSESGQRTLVQLDSSGNVMRRVNSGRLPVGMVGNPATESVIAAVATDEKLIQFSSSGKGGSFASLPDYPNDITGDQQAVWVIMWLNGSNADTAVIRYDQRTKQSAKSQNLGSHGSDIVKAGNLIWVSHGTGQGSRLSVLDPNGLNLLPTIPLSGHLSALAGNETEVFVGGGVWDVSGEIVRVDSTTMRETHRRQLPGEFIYRVAADSDHVVAIGYRGTIWLMSARDLSLQKVARLSWGQFAPAAAMIHDGCLYITTHRGNGDNGSVLVIDDLIEGGHR